MAKEWKKQAEAEPNSRTRAVFASLGLVFVGLTRHAATWRRGLEQWNMRESPIVNERRAEGRAEREARAARRNLLQILEFRSPGQVTSALAAVVGSQSDLAALDRRVEPAMTAPSPSAFLAAAGTGRPG